MHLLCTWCSVYLHTRFYMFYTTCVCTRVRSHVRALARLFLGCVSRRLGTVKWISRQFHPTLCCGSLFRVRILFRLFFPFLLFSLSFFFSPLQLLLRPGSRFPANRSFRARFHCPFSFFRLLYKLDYINNYLSITFYATFLVSHLTRRLV